MLPAVGRKAERERQSVLQTEEGRRGQAAGGRAARRKSSVRINAAGLAALAAATSLAAAV